MHFVIRRPGGDDELVVARRDRHLALARRLGGEDQTDSRPVHARCPIRRVVYLKLDLRSGLDQLGAAGFHHLGHRAGRIAYQKLGGAFGLLVFTGLPRRLDERDHMVNQGAIAWPHFNLLHPLVLSKGRRDGEVFVLDRTGRRNLILHRHLEDQIGRSDVPAFLPGVALRSAIVSPGDQRLDVGWGERAVVGELTEVRVGIPRRHSFEKHRLANRLRPRSGFLIGEQGHRRRFPGPMAALAVLGQNRGHVLAERHRRLFAGLAGRVTSSEQARQAGR